MSETKRVIRSISEASPGLAWMQETLMRGLKAGPVVVEFKRESRSVDQNALLWALLADISNQVTWFDRKHSPEVWKDIITGSFRGAEFVPNLEGTGFVMIGLRTSKMDKPTFSALIDYIHSFGADQNIQWSDPSLAIFQQYREAEK